MAARQRIQEQFIPFENYRSEWDQPKQLELFRDEEKAEILDVLNANDNQSCSEIEPLDFNEL